MASGLCKMARTQSTRWEEGQVIPTYANHTVKPAPKAPTPEAEAQPYATLGAMWQKVTSKTSHLSLSI